MSKINKPIKNAREKIERALEEGGRLPPSLTAKYRKYTLYGIIIILIGLIMDIVLFPGILMKVTGIGFTTAIGVILIVWGIYYKNKILEEGYLYFDGTCIDHEYGNPIIKIMEGDWWPKLRVRHLIIECRDDMFSIPINHLNTVVPIGRKVRIYVPVNANVRNTGEGISAFTSIYGYALISDPDDEEDVERRAEEKGSVSKDLSI